MLTIYFLSSVLRRQLRNRLFYVWAFAGFVFVASASQLANCQELTAESGSPRAVEPTEPTESTELVEAASEPVQDSFEASIIKIKPHNELIVQAFKETSDGWSSDEVILQIELNEKFLAVVHEKLKILDVAEVADAAINWRLMTLRKAGKLKIKSTRRAKRSQQDVQPLAEIAMRSIQDKSKLSSDRIMADPVLRGEFDAVVKGLQSGVDLYAVRKAAFQLRKIRRLQPELISRLADWGRVVATYSIADLRKQFVGQMAPVGSHKIVGVDRPYCYGILIRPGIAHHSNALDWQENGEYLRRLSIQPSCFDFANDDMVRFA